MTGLCKDKAYERWETNIYTRKTLTHFPSVTFLTYIAEFSRQCAEFVDGVQRHHGHWGNGQTPPHHIGPWRKHVGAIVWRVERGKAHHHHKLWKKIIWIQKPWEIVSSKHSLLIPSPLKSKWIQWSDAFFWYWMLELVFLLAVKKQQQINTFLLSIH